MEPQAPRPPEYLQAAEESLRTVVSVRTAFLAGARQGSVPEGCGDFGLRLFQSGWTKPQGYSESMEAVLQLETGESQKPSGFAEADPFAQEGTNRRDVRATHLFGARLVGRRRGRESPEQTIISRIEQHGPLPASAFDDRHLAVLDALDHFVSSLAEFF